MVKDLGRPAAVASREPYLTEVMKLKRMSWCKSKLRKPKRFWQEVLFVDELFFRPRPPLEDDLGASQVVRRPKGAPRSDPRSDPRSVEFIHWCKVCDHRYTRKEWKRGQ